MYLKIGEINSFEEIPWGEEIIITGSCGNGWYWHAKGRFSRNADGCRFQDDCDVCTSFNSGDFISLNVLEKVNVARKPEGSDKSDGTG